MQNNGDQAVFDVIYMIDSDQSANNLESLKVVYRDLNLSLVLSCRPLLLVAYIDYEQYSNKI